PSIPFTVPAYTSAGDFGSRPADNRATAAPPGTEATTSVRDHESEAGLRTNKITAEGTAPLPGTGSITSARDRASEADLRTNKITTDVTGPPTGTGVTTSVRERAR